MNIFINDDIVRDWLNKFDSNNEISLLTEIANDNICISTMNDSMLSHKLGDTENAEFFYKIMWRK